MNTPGKLYLIPSILAPGSTNVIPEQTTSIICKIDYFLVENVRSARRFISALNLGVQIEQLHFELVDKKTTFEETMELLEPIRQGKDGGMLSEAGCPGIADPGALPVSSAHQLGIEIVPLVGPSSILLALMGSGFSGQSFVFHGYLPIDQNERKNKIRELERAALKTGQTQIFMETPYRNEHLLQSMLQVCHNNTRLCIASDLTGENQMIKTLSIQSWKKSRPSIHKVPAIFIIGR